MMKIFKNIAGVCFGIAFLMALVLFGDIGLQYISITTARYIFMISGALGLIFNLLSFQTGKHSPIYNFLYWSGSIILFGGLAFLQFRIPYGFQLLVAGMIVLGSSFFIPASLINKEQKDEDILDDL